MRRERCHSIIQHYGPYLIAASLMSFMVTACGVRHVGDDGPRGWPMPERKLAFENATMEPVSIFLEERGSQWFVGYAMPGQTADFRLPTAANNLGGREFTLVVVSASARRGVRARSSVGFPGPVTAEQLRGDYLTNVRWKLSGNWLVPMPIPRRP